MITDSGVTIPDYCRPLMNHCKNSMHKFDHSPSHHLANTRARANAYLNLAILLNISHSVKKVES
jgi:hypothetical protein